MADVTRDDFLAAVGDPHANLRLSRDIEAEAADLWRRVSPRIVDTRGRPVQDPFPDEVDRICTRVRDLRECAHDLKRFAYRQMRAHNDPRSHLDPAQLEVFASLTPPTEKVP